MSSHKGIFNNGAKPVNKASPIRHRRITRSLSKISDNNSGVQLYNNSTKRAKPADKVLPIRNRRITRSCEFCDDNAEVQLPNNSPEVELPNNSSEVQLPNHSSHNILPSYNNESQTAKRSEYKEPNKTFGFLGLGIMGSGMVKNLLKSGHKVIIWERDYNKYCKFVEDDGCAAEKALTPCDVFDRADITFSCISNPEAVLEIIFENYGILSSTTIAKGKGYVEMTGIDSKTSLDIASAITLKGGRYLEAQLQGSKQQADEGNLIILGAGEFSLFAECQSCFAAIAKNSFFLGNIGSATNMYLVLQMISGINLAALAEGLHFADRLGLKKQEVLNILSLTSTSSSMIMEKGNAINNGDYSTNEPLLHMQKDLKLALQMSENLTEPLPLAATTNAIFKRSVKNGLASLDTAAIYLYS